MSSQLSDIQQRAVSPTQSTTLSPVTARPKNVSTVSAGELTGDIALAWNRLRTNQSLQNSPYFDIEFTQAVAAVRDDVEIAIIRKGNEIVGIYPFQRVSTSHAEPVGGRLNDAQGLIGGQSLSSEELLRAFSSIGINSSGFHASVKPNGPFDQFEFCQIEAHHLNLSEGWDSFYRWAKKNSSTIKRHGQKSRALEREFGKIRFEFENNCDAALEKLVELKRAKYQRTKTFDILSVDWASNLLRHIHKIKSKQFSGILSTMYVGDRFVAGHFGMVTDQLLHYWFPTFDPEFSRFSPGTELLLRVAKECCDRGISKLDLGYGDDAYKFKFCNGTDPASCGLITGSKVSFQAAKMRFFWRQRLKGMPLKPTAKRILRKVYPGFGGWNFK
jgi:CelD/BcsL family acetyltransferase involved in cellulose biosynthesis